MGNARCFSKFCSLRMHRKPIRPTLKRTFRHRAQALNQKRSETSVPPSTPPTHEPEILQEDPGPAPNAASSLPMTDEDVWSAVTIWVQSRPMHDLQMLSLLCYEIGMRDVGLNIGDSSKLAAQIVGRSARTVNEWRRNFIENEGEFPPDMRGKYARVSIMTHEDCRVRAAKWARAHACVRGEPNMTVTDFAYYMNNTLLPSMHLPPGFPTTISAPTACRFLHSLGFERKSANRKSVYMDGHERPDVVAYREKFISTLILLQSTHKPPPLPSDQQPDPAYELADPSAAKHLVTIYHDESTFQSNDDQTMMWAQPDQTSLKPKGRGPGIMVSDFIDEFGGFLKASNGDGNPASAARVTLEIGANRDGYWKKENIVSQLHNAVAIAERAYPKEQHTLLWIFDQSSNHTAMADDALVASRMNVTDDGKQPRMRDTTFNGRHFSMVDPSTGKAKGLLRVLTERGVDCTGMLQKQMQEELSTHEDFANEKSLLEHVIESRGHHVLFLPKYHCEMNPIERVWGDAKRVTRAKCNYTIGALRRVIPEALDQVSLDLMRKFFRKVRDYQHAYSEGKSGLEAEDAVKKYKSHRRVNRESFTQ